MAVAMLVFLAVIIDPLKEGNFELGIPNRIDPEPVINSNGLISLNQTALRVSCIYIQTT